MSRSGRPARRRQRSLSRRPHAWQLQDAKARFSELVRRAKSEGPQRVTIHGREEVIVIGAEDFRRLAGNRTGQALVDAMQASPYRTASIAPTRSRSPTCSLRHRHWSTA